jgi:DNA modification methylase
VTHGHKDGDTQTRRGYNPPKLANPGNVVSCPIEETSSLIKCSVGKGNMGSLLCHENVAPFPEKLAELFIRSFCPPGGVVLDVFLGSGTTLAVALRHGRRALGCDLLKSQCELSLRRLQEERAKGPFRIPLRPSREPVSAVS